MAGSIVIQQKESVQSKCSEIAYFLMLRLKSCYHSVLQYLRPESMSREQLEICVVDPTGEPEKRKKIWPQHLAAILGKVSYLLLQMFY